MKKNVFYLTIILLPICACAQTDVWDGSAERWMLGNGTKTDPYLIETAENLAFLAKMVNDFSISFHGVYLCFRYLHSAKRQYKEKDSEELTLF